MRARTDMEAYSREIDRSPDYQRAPRSRRENVTRNSRRTSTTNTTKRKTARILIKYVNVMIINSADLFGESWPSGGEKRFFIFRVTFMESFYVSWGDRLRVSDDIPCRKKKKSTGSAKAFECIQISLVAGRNKVASARPFRFRSCEVLRTLKSPLIARGSRRDHSSATKSARTGRTMRTRSHAYTHARAPAPVRIN